MSERDPGDDPKETLDIQNVVASTGIGHELDLDLV
jgi:TATA-box binding protein (TBP) (component of TFIID and TFIIIB)